MENGEDGGFDGVNMSQQQQEEEGDINQQELVSASKTQNEEDEDVIDIDNPDELAKKGLKRI